MSNVVFSVRVDLLIIVISSLLLVITKFRFIGGIWELWRIWGRKVPVLWEFRGS